MNDEIHEDFFASDAADDISLPAEPFDDRQSSMRVDNCQGGVHFDVSIDEKLCQWPLWNASERTGHVCGQPRHWREADGGKVRTAYCAFHYRKAYTPRGTPSGN